MNEKPYEYLHVLVHSKTYISLGSPLDHLHVQYIYIQRIS